MFRRPASTGVRRPPDHRNKVQGLLMDRAQGGAARGKEPEARPGTRSGKTKGKNGLEAGKDERGRKTFLLVAFSSLSFAICLFV